MNNNFIHHSLNSKDEVLSWKLFLSHYSLESINQHFENYKALCHLDSINPNRIEKAIKSLFKITYNGGYFSPFFLNNNKPKIRPVSFPYYFFRIRKLTKGSWIEFGKDGINFDAMEFEEIQTMVDIWERPAEQVDNYQRLNKPHASVSYQPAIK
ncbi:hypothetical protein EZS27_042234 [termite gut metagenome]|uniref:Uncharacterized protein n=1 Tax=termite gut metagenome TaxID=433724 RepID=A0A5J4PAU3_9ZZZZ